MFAIRESTAVAFRFYVLPFTSQALGKGASVLRCKPPNPRRCDGRSVRSLVKAVSLEIVFRRKIRSRLWHTTKKGTADAVPFLVAYHEGFVRSTKCDGIAKTAQLICEQSRADAVERQPRGRIPQGKKKGTERVRCLWRTMRVREERA